MPLTRWVERPVERIERLSVLDQVARPLDAPWRAVLRPQWLRDAASGTWLGHPAHPAAILLPAGTLLSATSLDLTGGPAVRVAARRLVATGLVTAVPAVVAGWSDWLDTKGAERRTGVVHATANVLGLAAYATSYLQRRRGSGGRLAAVGGAAALGAGGWLGGHLAYAQGVGVDTNALSAGAIEWTDIAASDDVTASLLQVDVDETALLLTRVRGEVVALADRCSHRGGRLSDGERTGDDVICPWHGSRFALTDGAVCNGPATRPQPTYQVRERAGRVSVRRDEPRSLRSNAT